MKLLIHDLDKEEWDKVCEKYNGWKIISNNGKIKPCVGCFGCWTKNPGECVVKDGYENVSALMHNAEEITVISRYTYGGFSSSVKNIFDKSVGGVLPFFEVFEGEMHHKKRYPTIIPVTFIFRGNHLTAEEKAKAERYVRAVCRNMRSEMKEILFEEYEEQEDESGLKYEGKENSAANPILLNCSLRGERANSERFLDCLAGEVGGDVERLRLVDYMNRPDELIELLLSAEKIVLGMPLYIDGIPSAMLRIMEKIEKCRCNRKIKVYSVINMGLYESKQICNILSMVKLWCEKCGFVYSGGLAIGGGEMISRIMKAGKAEKSPARNAVLGLVKLAEVIRSSEQVEDIYADPFRFPRFIYILISNSLWPRGAAKNGIRKKDLYLRR
ncbi:MAG: flavodoxin family protein [Lachnospiraceae bacterium]|nr:flavodoxin family protein [Lachnospiraceae bacterium]